MAYTYGQKLDPSLMTGNELTPYLNANTSGLDFGQPPIAGAKPNINPFTGEFMGWLNPFTGKAMVPTSVAQGPQMGPQQYSDAGVPGWMDSGGPVEAYGQYQHEVSPYVKYGVLGTLGAMGGYGALAAGGALGAGAALEGAGGTGTLAASSLPASAGVTGSELGMLGGAAGTGGVGTLSASSLPAAFGSGIGGSELGMLGAGGSALSGAGSMGGASQGYPTTGGNTGWPDLGGNPVPRASGTPTGVNDYMKYIQGAGGLLGSTSGSGSNQNGTGSLLGGLVGAGLGYLDSRNQPNSFTTTTQIDPRLAEFAYGPNGTAAMAQQAAAANGGQYLTNAGQQISQLGQQAPTAYNDLVKNNQSLWSANPFIDEQRKAIMDTLNTNFANNTNPAIGGAANVNGGYGGSRQGIAQGLAINSMNQNAAPALANLASNAFESSQNRAMQGAQYQGQYGLAGTAQQANLIGQGGQMQAQAPWFNATQFGNLTRQLPGNSSQTQPLFNNTTAAALGGAQTGSQYGGNIDWGQLAGTIGSWFK